MSDKQAEMWAAFEAHKPEPAYADAWRVMLKERTWAALEAVYRAAPEWSAARQASWDAYKVAEAQAQMNDYAQSAINAIKREVKP